MVLCTRLSAFTVALLTLAPGAIATPRGRSNETQPIRLMDADPIYPHDPNTIATCTWWWDNDGSIPCASMPAEWGISMENFLRWNPSITSSCGNFLVQRSYCVEAPAGNPDPVTTTSTSAAPTTTKPPNGVETPEPTQPGMVSNCNKFYFVSKGQSCSAVLSAAQVSLEQLYEWNPTVGSNCGGLWAEVNVCVGVIGQATSTTARPTSTTPPNGITTPTPIQDGMVSNCNKFYFVQEGQTCSNVLSSAGVSLAQLFQWNPSVKSDCSGLWSKVNVCIGVIGQATSTTARPTSTAPGNGIPTPTPIQDGMVGNCNKFYFVPKGATCQQVLNTNGVSLADFAKWNPAVGSNCGSLWAETYACVGVVGQATTTTQRPTTTTRGNGVATPTPTQPGMVSNCNKFHFISKGNTCQQIVDYQRITMANFLRWNAGFGSNCELMWADAYACVGVF